MRKLKKSVKVVVLLAGVIFTGGFAMSNIDKEIHVNADVQDVTKQKFSYIEKLEKNHALSEGMVGGVEAFYLLNDGEYSVFISKASNERVYVHNDVLEKSFADGFMQIGDNVTLHSQNLNTDFVSVTGGKAINLIELYLHDYSEDYSKISYEDNQGNIITFNKEFVEDFKLNNNANIGSVAIGYEFNDKVIAVQTGY